jgi:uncharacterized RDD family membrane protein YckC
VGQARCPACGRALAPPVEGALAPQPQVVTPPAADKAEPLREIPGLRRRERCWKDEVRDRVRLRRQERSLGTDLPLFPDEDDEEAPVGDFAEAPPASSAPAAITQRVAAAPPEEPPLRELGLGDDAPELPLRDPVEAHEAPVFDAPRLRDVPLRDAEPSLRAGLPEPELDEWAAPEPPALDSRQRPVERPARLGERLHAAFLDLGVLLVLWSAVLYFSTRAARVGIAGLRPAWPYLIGYLAFLGFVYAGYFTGTTGRTLGKMACGLRVVDRAGRPPGLLRAALRATLGALGTLAAGAGLVPMLFDPARRGLHDRLLRTRVVKS